MCRRFSVSVPTSYDAGFERLEKVSKLEFLDLEYNLFNNESIVSSIGHLSSLKSLNLADNGLESITDIQGLSSLQNLVFLDLSFNNFNDSIISFLRIFPSLKSLNLADNRLESGIQGLSGLENLEFLDLSSNNFSKSIIPLLSVFIFKIFNIDGQQIRKITDFQGLSKLSNLEFLDLSGNDFGNSTLSSIGDLSSLKELHLDNCGLRGTVDIQKLDALGNLKVLSLGGNQITKVVDSRDAKIIRNLSSLFLAYNWYGRSSIQLELLGAYPFLKTLSLMDYSFKGGIFAQDLDISDNYFNGSIPTEIGVCFPSLNSLDLSGNGLTGGIPSSFGKMSLLKELNLSRNGLTGGIPSLFGKMSLLKELNLSRNGLTGGIPSSFGKMSQLIKLDLSNNHLSGKIPQELIVGCSSLYELILSTIVCTAKYSQNKLIAKN
ncbi:hypothetical protein GH714_024373 [Hevea brasiliensis]|uniref:Leucine-rich repeat-containing N-terminal plant-type domain-containing protein n=1 Tax=Hevea brasiliensis TaxID=3981 RepID=A0A6A6MVK5_HEVBR|nr:hypothetical protein GH714_024373 [Hevea brasiliensis]